MIPRSAAHRSGAPCAWRNKKSSLTGTPCMRGHRPRAPGERVDRRDTADLNLHAPAGALRLRSSHQQSTARQASMHGGSLVTRTPSRVSALYAWNRAAANRPLTACTLPECHSQRRPSRDAHSTNSPLSATTSRGALRYFEGSAAPRLELRNSKGLARRTHRLRIRVAHRGTPRHETGCPSWKHRFLDRIAGRSTPSHLTKSRSAASAAPMYCM
jgi:hypothetical protein